VLLTVTTATFMLSTFDTIYNAVALFSQIRMEILFMALSLEERSLIMNERLFGITAAGEITSSLIVCCSSSNMRSG
jgi:hypothetical protein